MSDESLESWIYVAFTRATKHIKIFVSDTNPCKKEICDYFNKRIIEVEPNNQLVPN